MPVTLMRGAPPEDSAAGRRRRSLLTVTAPVAAVGAATPSTFTLLRRVFDARRTRMPGQDHVTDRINTAVAALGAQKTVSRIGRPVTVTTPGGEGSRTEGPGPPLDPGDGAGIARRGDWRTVEETVPVVEVRLCGIHALERIVRQSPDDHVPVMEIPTADTRENAPAGIAPLRPGLAPLPAHRDARRARAGRPRGMDRPWRPAPTAGRDPGHRPPRKGRPRP